MKTYSLWLHYKQGDDFANILKDSKNVSEAFRTWAQHFEACRDRCQTIADALENQAVEIDADTHAINLHAGTPDASKKLRALVDLNILSPEEE
jgi:hypothetical protein